MRNSLYKAFISQSFLNIQSLLSKAISANQSLKKQQQQL